MVSPSNPTTPALQAHSWKPVARSRRLRPSLQLLSSKLPASGSQLLALSFRLILPCLLILSPGFSASAQNFHAIQGSSEAGSLGIANNPASIVNTPFAWDIDILSMQVKSSTNAVTVYNNSFAYAYTGGNDIRHLDLNANLHLLNARFALDSRQAIAFGINLRSYTHATSSGFNYNDSLHNLNNFFQVNNPKNVYEAYSASSSWLELFGTYSRTLFDNGGSRLNAGATLKISRALSGAYARLQNATVTSAPADPSDPTGPNKVYSLNTAFAQYGYSSNYDRWKNGQTTTHNLKDFLGNTRTGLGLDLGVEYLIRPDAPLSFSGRDDYYDYDWKIGISILDIGNKKFKYGTQSRYYLEPRPGITDTILDHKVDAPHTLSTFNDSLATVFTTAGLMAGDFNIYDPTRVVINIDHWLGGDFYINGEYSLNLGPTDNGKSLGVREMNIATLTPRWETHKWGIYLPMTYNTYHQFWVGAAFKAGPVLLGFHNLANFVSKTSTQNGGGYIAFLIRAGHSNTNGRDKRYLQYDCPKN